MTNLLQKVASPEILNQAWKHLRNDKAIWSPGISKKDMESNFTYHILKLSEELSNGKYKPAPVRFFVVNKGNGKQRIISALTLRDKVAQRAVLKVIEPILEATFHNDSFGYRPGKNIDMAFSKVKEYLLCDLLWIIDADIQSYFDNIPHRPLIKILKSLINDRPLLNLIKRWLDSGTIRRGILSSPKGIPQGAIISPILCNVYLTSLDQDMADKNLPFVRFADDFLVFVKSKKEAIKAHKYVEKSLKKLKLSLNLDKTKISYCSPNIIFLGKKLPNVQMIKKAMQK